MWHIGVVSYFQHFDSLQQRTTRFHMIPHDSTLDQWWSGVILFQVSTSLHPFSSARSFNNSIIVNSFISVIGYTGKPDEKPRFITSPDGSPWRKRHGMFIAQQGPSPSVRRIWPPPGGLRKARLMAEDTEGLEAFTFFLMRLDAEYMQQPLDMMWHDVTFWYFLTLFDTFWYFYFSFFYMWRCSDVSSQKNNIL